MQKAYLIAYEKGDGDLYDMIMKEGDEKLTVNLAADLTGHLLRGLQVLHNKFKTIHGDLKPQNIVIFRRAVSAIAKIIDFDGSKKFGEQIRVSHSWLFTHPNSEIIFFIA